MNGGGDDEPVAGVPDLRDSALTSTPSGGPAKRDVLRELGEQPLLLPLQLNHGLEANSRAKYFLSLLQAARSHADAPAEPYSSLRDERCAAGLLDPEFDHVVERSRRIDGDTYYIPGASGVLADLAGAIRDMLAPLAAAEPPGTPSPARLDVLLEDDHGPSNGTVRGRYIDQITSGRREAGDSLHLLVMDAHRALIRLQAQLATTSIDGAAVYGLAADDPGLVAAFMAGLHETEALRFDHPGLATTATRSGERLIIQNDLGTTSAHVLVLAVDGRTVTLTHTDVHLRRLRFLQSLLEGYAVRWSDTEHRHGGAGLGGHHLTVGRYQAADRADLEAYLRQVGSRLVFVLDWNRARKRLSTFLGRGDAVAMLRWAADNNVGHMAFLILGGERLIYDAVELAAKVPARYGEPLSEVLGREATLAITRFALRAAAEGMLAGKSQLLIRDELRVEVLRHFQASHRSLLDADAEHASLIVETAQALRAAIVRLGTPGAEDYLSRATGRAAAWEHRADEILTGQRQAARRVEDGDILTALTTTADDAIDVLEETIFLLTLLPEDARTVVLPILDPLATVTVMTAREYLKAVEIGRQIMDAPTADDLEDFLVAVDQVATLEHEADSADRMARAALVTAAPEFRSLYVADGISRGAEDATDSLLRAALGLRDHVLGLLAVP
ncbi:MAG TPA: hypothetical protein VF834_23465 [Streptosporangiaceae bacterium]